VKCKACQKRINFDHYSATKRPGAKGESVRLVFQCDCGFYVIPLDVVEITGSKALVSSSDMEYWKIGADVGLSGEKLSQEGTKIYKEQGEEAYEKWKKEVYFPLMDAKAERMKRHSFRRRI
jgi:hypothetical protein